MSLNDPAYLGFLLGVFLLFYALRPGEPRRILLLVAGYIFFFELSRCFIAVLLVVTAVTYFGAFLLRSKSASTRGSLFIFLLCGIVILPLVLFKYMGASLGGLALPVGVSFFTFAALGYLIDVYLEVVDPEPSLSRVALFLAFFPLISAGPIERASGLMPQLDCDRPFSSDRAFSALRLILLGLVLKNLLSEILAEPANTIFANPSTFSAFEQLCGTVYYAFYIYADFAGYSLLAIGSAKLFGFDVRPNFRQPFLSTTMQEFWRNWHMSLSSWVRDYVFAPLRMQWRRQKEIGMIAALVISFIVVGVWHGARWGYLVYGILHGLLVAASTLTLARRNAFWTSLGVPQFFINLVRIPVTFLLVTLVFVVYRANSMHDAIGMYRSIFSLDLVHGFTNAVRFYAFRQGVPPFQGIHGFLGWMVITTILVGDILARCKLTLEKLPIWFHVSACNAALVFVILNWLTRHASQPFHYYQF